MSYIASEPNYFGLDAGGRTRISQITTLHDGKILNKDNTYIWDNQGTGTGLWGANKYDMSVTAGQFLVRQSKRYLPYSSGKSQLIETTFDNFQVEAGVTKRVGYFSSIKTTPFDTALDGFFLENDGTTFRLRAYRAGTSTLDIPWTSWDNYAQVSGYDWSKFTVVAFDFLWLGGAVLRFFIKTSRGFVLCHTFNYASTATDVFILSPNQPVRYEIRSTSGVGSLRSICSQVATEGSINENGYNVSVNSLSTLATPVNSVAAIGTTYPLKGIRKKAGFRDSPAKFLGINIATTSANDICMWSIQLNPTITGTIGTWVDLNPSNAVVHCNGSDTTVISATVTTQGKVIASGFASATNIISSGAFERDFLSYLGCSITDVMDEIWLCIQPVTANINLVGTVSLKEY